MPFLPIVAVARREWSLLRKDPKPRVVLGVVTLLIPLSVYANAREFDALAARARDLHVQRSADTESRKGVLIGRDMEPSLRVVRDPVIGFTLANGHDRHLPLYWDVGPAGLRYGPPAGAYSAGPSGPRVDVEYVVRVVLGLFALLLGLEAIGGERQNKTLRPLFAQPISTASVIIGKSVANAAVLIAMAVWTVALGHATVVIYAKAAAIPFPVVTGLTLLACAYLMFCFFLGLACSSLGSTIPRAQTAALSLWLLQSVVSVPLVGSLVDALAHPRTRADFEGELQRAYDITNREASKKLGSELLARVHGHDLLEVEKDPREQKRMVRELEPMWNEYAQRWAEDMIGRESQWNAHRQQQDTTLARMSTISAGLLFNRLAGDIVGTGQNSASLWQQAAMQYQSRLYEPLVVGRAKLILHVPVDETYVIFNLPRRNQLRVSEIPTLERPGALAVGIQPADSLRLVAQLCFAAAVGCAGVVRLRKRHLERR